MYNQAQGVYPQLAGSFTNVPGMSPHDNGRAATQVPTMGPLQSYFNAGDILAGREQVPFGQSHLRSHADATSTRLSLYGAAGAIGLPAIFSAGLGLLPGTTAAISSAGVGLLALPSVFEYAKARNRTREMQQMMAGVNVAPGLRDIATGGIHKGAANQLYNSLSGAAGQLGGTTKDLLSTTQMAGQMGMLSGYGQSVSAITSRVMDLAKASRDIISLGEGISLSDAMQLQQITQDIGISNAKFRGMGIGKTLLAGAKIANMSLQEVTQAGLGGAQMYSQLGFSSAAGIQAGVQSTIGAATMVNNGMFSASQLARLGGQSGIQQNLLETGAMSLAGISQNLISGAVRFNSQGGAYIDRNLLDRYMRGEVSAEEMEKRGQRIRQLPRSQQAAIRTQMRLAMPELMESISEQYGPNAQMGIAAREIMNLRASRGMNIHDAAYQYFGGDQAKVETFMAFAQNYPAMMDEQRRQEHQQFNEEMASSRGLGVNRSGIGYRLGQFGGAVYDLFAVPGRALGEKLDRMETLARNEAMGVFGEGSALVRTGPRRFRARDVSLESLREGKGGGTSDSILTRAIRRLGRAGAGNIRSELDAVFGGDIEASRGSSLIFSDDAGLQALERVLGKDLGDYAGALHRMTPDNNEELRRAGIVALRRYQAIQAPMSLGMASASFFDVGRRQNMDMQQISDALSGVTTEFARRFRAVTQAGSNMVGITYTQGSSMNLSVEAMRQEIKNRLPAAVRDRIGDTTLDSMARGVIAQLRRDGDDDVRGGIAKVFQNDKSLASLVRIDGEASGTRSIIDELGIDRDSIRGLHAAGMSSAQVAEFLNEYGLRALRESKVNVRYTEDEQAQIASGDRSGNIDGESDSLTGVDFGSLDEIIRKRFSTDPNSAKGRHMKAILQGLQRRSKEGFTVSSITDRAARRSGEGLVGTDTLTTTLEATLRNEQATEYLDRLRGLQGSDTVHGYFSSYNRGGLSQVNFGQASNVRELVGEEFYNRYVGNNMGALGELQQAFEATQDANGGDKAKTSLLRVIKQVADRAQEGAGGGRGGSGGVTTAQALKSVSDAIDAFKTAMTELATKARAAESSENPITIRIVGS